MNNKKLIYVIGAEKGLVGISEENANHPGGMAWVVGGDLPVGTGRVQVYRTSFVMDRLNRGLLKEVPGPEPEPEPELEPEPESEPKPAVKRSRRKAVETKSDD